MIASINSRIGDPDRQPWILKDSDGQEFTGNVEGSQQSSYVLFVFTDDGFKMIPASKWYRFVPKVNYRTLSIEEAEEKMKIKSRARMSVQSDRWIMKKEGAQGDGKGKESLLQKLRKLPANIEEEEVVPKKTRQKVKQEDGEGMDYEEQFEDDEDINFGIDDAEEAKEAADRMYGRAGTKALLGDEDDLVDNQDPDAERIKNPFAKKIAKSLLKHDNNEAYDDLDEDNPYVSEIEDEEEEEEEPQKEVKPEPVDPLILAKKEADFIRKIEQKVAASLPPPNPKAQPASQPVSNSRPASTLSSRAQSPVSAAAAPLSPVQEQPKSGQSSPQHPTSQTGASRLTPRSLGSASTEPAAKRARLASEDDLSTSEEKRMQLAVLSVISGRVIAAAAAAAAAGVMPIVGEFPLQRIIIRRERAGGSYRSSSAFLAKVVSTLPTLYVGCLLLCVPLYWMVGLQADATKYFTFLCIVLVHVTTTNALGLMIGAGVPNVKLGQILTPLCLVILMLFGGQLVNLDKIPSVLRWIQWISPISYSNKALNQNEFNGIQLDPCPIGQSCYASGDSVIGTYGLGTPTLWVCVIINCCLTVAFLFGGYLLFDRTSRPLLKLK
eukprot:jgi/Hompol1/1956/HPOL_000592-RA